MAVVSSACARCIDSPWYRGGNFVDTSLGITYLMSVGATTHAAAAITLLFGWWTLHSSRRWCRRRQAFHLLKIPDGS